VRRAFLSRSAMVGEIRRFLEERGYLEVETPMMHAGAGRRGGAAVRDATTTPSTSTSICASRPSST